MAFSFWKLSEVNDLFKLKINPGKSILLSWIGFRPSFHLSLRPIWNNKCPITVNCTTLYKSAALTCLCSYATQQQFHNQQAMRLAHNVVHLFFKQNNSFIEPSNCTAVKQTLHPSHPYWLFSPDTLILVHTFLCLSCLSPCLMFLSSDCTWLHHLPGSEY